MTVSALGKVYLNNIRFTTDPGTYTRNWPRRMSVHKGLQGAVTIQSFGRFAKDMVLQLGSGSNQWMELSLVQAIESLMAVDNGVYSFTDWIGNAFTVFILSFDPDPTFIGTLHTYSMSLQVRSILTLHGVTYTGS